MKKIRVIIVEDQSIIREGLAAILSFQPDIEVVGQGKDGIEAVELLEKTHPDVILLDLVMPRQDGLTTIPILKAKQPSVHILVLSSFADNEHVYPAIKSGAEGYMLKDATHTQLLQGIRDVAQGQASLYPSIAMQVIREMGGDNFVMVCWEPPGDFCHRRVVAAWLRKYTGVLVEEFIPTMRRHAEWLRGIQAI